MIKRVSVFVAMKILEITGVAAILYCSGLSVGRWIGYPTEKIYDVFIGGMLGVIVATMLIGCTCMILAFLIEIVKANWVWAGKITRKKF